MKLQNIAMLPATTLLILGLIGCVQNPPTVTDEGEPNPEKQGLADEESERPPDTASPHIKRLADAEKCFEVAGFEAYVYQFSGGFVECWLEVETDGKKEVIAKIQGGSGALETANVMRNAHKNQEGGREQPYTEKDAAGHVIFMRPNSAESVYADQWRWNLQYELTVGSRSSGAGSATGHRLVETIPIGPAMGRYAWSGARPLQPDEEVTLQGWTWTEPQAGGADSQKGMSLKCKLLTSKTP